MPAPAFRPPDFRPTAHEAVSLALGMVQGQLTQLKNQGKGDTPAARRLASLMKELLPIFAGDRPLDPGSPLARFIEDQTRRAEAARGKIRFGVCGPLEVLSAFPPGLGALPTGCTPVTRREAKELARNLEGLGALEGMLLPEPRVPLPRPAVAGPGPAPAVRAVSEGAPRAPRPPRAPRRPRAARKPRSPRVPRRPRKPRPPRPPRPPRVQRKRALPTQGKGSGWFWYCVKQGPGKFETMDPSCHRLHVSQAAAASAVYTGATFTRTEECEDCEGKGCTGPFAGPFVALLNKLFDKPAYSPALTEPERRAVRARRRQQRKYLITTERTVGDFQASLHAPALAQPSGYGWYRCSTPATPLRAAFTHVVWIHASQAAAANAAGGGLFCDGPLGHNPNQKPL